MSKKASNNLTLVVNAEYFAQIKSGEKTEEYRLYTPYWQKRIEGYDFDQLILTNGYPKKTDLDRRLVFPWRGFTKKTITHPQFGQGPVEVFAIKLEQAEAN